MDSSEAAENENSCPSHSIFFPKCEAMQSTRCDGDIESLTAVAKSGGIYIETHFTAAEASAICSVAASRLQKYLAAAARNL